MTPRGAAAALVLLVVAPGIARAQRPPSPEEAARIAERMAAAAVPGPEHDRLAALAGSWDLEMRIVSRPGLDPVILRGSAENRMILGGRFLLSDYVAGAGGGDESSLVILGFDRRHGRYTLVGFDTWGTYYITAAGAHDPEQGAVVLSGEDHDPIAGHTQLYDFVLLTHGADAYTLEIWFKDEAHTGGGPPFRMVETEYRRR